MLRIPVIQPIFLTRPMRKEYLFSIVLARLDMAFEEEGVPMRQHQMVLVLDFGGQYNQLIARRVRDEGVYCEMIPGNAPLSRIRELKPVGIILTGGPNSVYAPGAPSMDPGVFNLGIPVLGICYGMQLMTHMLGGSVRPAQKREYGRAMVDLKPCALFPGLAGTSVCWMSHTDQAESLPAGFVPIASTDTCPIAAIANDEKRFFGVQFHPEVNHTEKGKEILRAFLYDICRCAGDWQMSSFIEETVQRLRQTIGSGKVLLALSGGVDSSVCAALLDRAVGSQLTCVFVNMGLQRKNEVSLVQQMFAKGFHLNLVTIDASDRFFSALQGVQEPERKRKIIGELFIRVFEDAAKQIGEVDFLAQGTIYPDVIESGAGAAAVIKSHHNVGGLPDVIQFRQIVEPLRDLFKDEVRRLGLQLGLPEEMIYRQPFPGPALAVRILGEVTREKVALLQEADYIFCEEIAAAGLQRCINQYFAVLTNMRSVGVMGDGRTYDYTVALRAVETVDFMTADWSRLPYEVLANTSSRIINEVGQVNRVVYDITPKPPATIEWE